MIRQFAIRAVWRYCVDNFFPVKFVYKALIFFNAVITCIAKRFQPNPKGLGRL